MPKMDTVSIGNGGVKMPKDKKEMCEESKIALHRLRTYGRTRMRKGYRKDPTEYETKHFDKPKKKKDIFEIIGDIESNENNNEER